MADRLMVTCKSCYTPFAVPNQMDEASFPAADYQTTSLECPECGIHRPYDEADHFFGASGPPPPWA